MAAVDNYNGISMDDFFYDNYNIPLDLSDSNFFNNSHVESPLFSAASTSQLPNQLLFSPVPGYATDHSNSNIRSEQQSKERDTRVAFRTKSDVEVMDDGFKWRKYGKKSVKNSPNPRNYYRCSTEGCKVKKRVERDPKEPCYVITTYDGIHNHSSPDTVYYATHDSQSGRFIVTGLHHGT